MSLKIQNLNKIYKSGFSALTNINLEINDGEKVALLGLNGAGKSTLVGILSGYIIKTSGYVEINGYNIEKSRIDATKTMGVVHQEIIYDTFFTVRETLKLHSGYYGIENNNEEINEILIALELMDKADVNTKFLSGGMKRRLMIAKALVTQPKFLILDEPTVGIDVNQRLNMWNYLDSIIKKLNITILLTTHYMYEAELLCDRVVVIHGGKIIADGKKFDILQRFKMKHVVLNLNYKNFNVSLIKNKQLLILNELKKINIDNISFIFNYLNIYLDDESLDSNLNFIKKIIEDYEIEICDMKINDADLEIAFTKIINEAYYCNS